LRARTNNAFLQAALLNLATNARDAMPNGGDLLIETARVHLDPVPPLAVGQIPAGDYAEVRATDTGVGMDADLVACIFEPLFSTKLNQHGHGLGLFMVQEFILRSGAGLALASQPGIGTTFRLFLPLPGPDDAAPGVQERLDPIEAPAPMLRVLVVEDDPRGREAIGRLLSIEGMLPAFAEHGADALNILRRKPDFDLVLSDIAMPMMDGVALCESLAELGLSHRVILMSGQDPSNFQIDDTLPGAIVLRKPIDLYALREAIARALIPR
jgi:CheY-like chemotaxis protein